MYHNNVLFNSALSIQLQYQASHSLKKIFLLLSNNLFFSYAGFIPFIGVFVSDAFQTLDGNLALGKNKDIVTTRK